MEPEKILVVDDDEALLFLMTSHLERQGYAVESTSNPFQALELLKTKSPFAVLLTDLMMPYMDGVQLLRKARQLDAHLEAVVITASASVETAIAAMREDGAYNYLMKPLENVNELSIAVKRAANYRRLQLEREELQARAQAETERLQSLIANIGDAILAADAQGKLAVINPAAARLLGRNNLIGCEALTSLPRPLAILLSNWRATSGQRPATIEITWPDTATQMVSLTPVTDAQGAAAGWVMVIRDISHLKQLDELKTQTLTDTANRIRMPLVQAMNLLTELSNPAALSAERMNDIVYRLVKTWQRIQQWADELLELAQYESGVSVTVSTVDTAHLLNDIMANLPQDMVRAKRLRLETSLSTDVTPVRADATMLRKALHGLITRAIARSEIGSTVRVALHEQDWQIWIDINDGGTPIAEVDLPHAFERSFVGSNLDSTGLELATAKAIIDKLGGQVWLRSPGPVGSIITVCLPTSTDPNAANGAALKA
ncbi:MAG TPA: response regulator [Anaerolineae bacterium]|nr:response regulator [Anaerolineae bacterium]